MLIDPYVYEGSLQDNQNIAKTVKTQYDALLQSKVNVILTLQSQLKEAKDKETER